MDLSNNKIRIQLLNSSEYTATIRGELHFLNPGKVFESSVEAPEYSIFELIFDISALELERGSYDGFLLIRGPDDLAITKKLTLYYPAADQQYPSGPQLEFLSREESLTINYGDLMKETALIEVGLINKGQKQVMVTAAEIVIFGLVDEDHGRIDQQFLEIKNPDLTIAPFNTASIEIKLKPQSDNQNSKPIPKDGDYAGYLLVQTDIGQPFIVKPVTLHVVALDPSLPTYLDQASRGIQLWVQGITGTQARFGPAEWSIIAILLVLLSVLLLELCRRLRLWCWSIRGRLGPIVVDEISSKPDLTASLRQNLATSGIIPTTAVPNPSTGMAGFVTVVSKSKIPEAALLQEILNFIAGYLRIRFGYTITSNLIGDETNPPVGISVQIKRTQSGKVDRIKTIEGDTYEQAVKKAAYFIFHYISGRKSALRRIPEWSRFPTHTSYLLYKEANLHKEAQDYAKAIERYESAAKEAPFNVLLRLGWGDAHELKKEHLKALGVYLEVVAMWPELYGFWYRIGVNFSFADVWFQEWEKLGEDEQTTLLSLIKDSLSQLGYEQDVHRLVTEKITQDDFFDLSKLIWEFLESQFSFEMMTINWVKALFNNFRFWLYQPAEFKPRLPRYYWGYIPVFPGGKGEQFRRLLTIAKYCSIEQSSRNKNIDSENKVKSELDQPWNSEAVYYNAACFYAILAANSEDPHKQAHEKTAIDLLKKAIRDPRTDFSHEWVKIDPDLKPLHTNLEFKAIFDIPDEKEVQSQETKERKAKYYALILVQHGALQQQKRILKWGKGDVSPQELLAGADHQARIWKNLINLADKPVDDTLQKLFWNSIMQYTNQLVSMPDLDKHPLPENLTLKKLNECWKTIKNDNQHLPELWESHAEDGKLFLEHGKTQMSDVWSLWAKAEKRQWEYIGQRIMRDLNGSKANPL